MESNSNTTTGNEPLENRIGENGMRDQEDENETEVKIELNHGEDTIDDLDDEEVKGQSIFLEFVCLNVQRIILSVSDQIYTVLVHTKICNKSISSRHDSELAHFISYLKVRGSNPCLYCLPKPAT